MKEAVILYGATSFGSEQFSGDLLWRTRFSAPDPFVALEIDGKIILLASALEYERALKFAMADEVILIDSRRDTAQNKTFSEVLISFLLERKVRKVKVSSSFPFKLAKALEKNFELKIAEEPLFDERAVKSEWEIKEIKKAQGATDAAMKEVRGILESSVIRKNKLVFEGKAVTSEILKNTIGSVLLEHGCLGIETIVSSGKDSAKPHSAGSGPILPYAPIVVDIFPVTLDTHYYADETRTFFKGEPKKEYVKMYETVLAAQETGISMSRSGADGYDISEEVSNLMAERGYKTFISKSRVEGFIHSLGHGVGIDIHEYPRIGKIHELLETGNVVTIEPGLYYSNAAKNILPGGIRIEDLIVVEKNGAVNLTKTKKGLDWAIVP